MTINDEPITRISSLEISGSETANNGFYTPQLTQAQINAIPLDEVQIGGIVYNADTQELQYFSPALQWVNVTSDEGEPTFSTLNVTGATTLNTLTTTGLTTLNSLNVTNNLLVGGTIYGKRTGGMIYNSNTPSFVIAANTPTKIPGTTVTSYANGFTATNNRLQFVAPPTISFLNLFITGSFNFQFSALSTIQISVAINGLSLNPTSYLTATAGNFFSVSISSGQAVVSNAGVGDYLELWVNSSAPGTFSAGGCMTLNVTQA